MATRSNACGELTRFWLEARHGCLATDGVPVAVPYGLPDIDLVGMRPRDRPITLPNGDSAGPNLIVETKDEHDFDPKGMAFGNMLHLDSAKLGVQAVDPASSPCSDRH